MGKSMLSAEVPQIELYGTSRVIVDDCDGILEYEPQTVKIRAGKRQVRLIGSDLVLCDLANRVVEIRGCIVSLEFEG